MLLLSCDASLASLTYFPLCVSRMKLPLGQGSRATEAARNLLVRGVGKD